MHDWRVCLCVAYGNRVNEGDVLVEVLCGNSGSMWWSGVGFHS